jgi:putative transposase
MKRLIYRWKRKNDGLVLHMADGLNPGSRRVHFAGCSAHPDNAWVTQQARQVMWKLEGRDPAVRFLIRDTDKKFTESFDTVFRSEGIDVIPTPHQAPNANAYAERWIRAVRAECLDKLLLINQAHLRRVMREYSAFFNTARPHQGLAQQIPVPNTNHQTTGQVRCRKVLGGIVHDYYRDAA